jgi:hypothetical protein
MFFLRIKAEQKEWRVVLIICAVVYFIGFVGYVILADGNVQSWAFGTSEEKQKEKFELKMGTEKDNVAYIEEP